MTALFDGFRDVTLGAVALRLVMAAVCGGLAGIEREYRRRPAGFRTHILVCLGAAMTTLTGQHLLLNLHYPVDITRLGAAVAAGIGFIGAGTIVVTHRQRVKGLTTAAGLWTMAVIGLAIGAGFYEGGLLATVLVLTAEVLFSRLEFRILENAPEINVYMEYRDHRALDQVMVLLREREIKVTNLEITRTRGTAHHHACAIFTLQMNRKCPVSELLLAVGSVEGVAAAEEL